MSSLENIIKDLNLPTQLIDKGEKLVVSLFGPSFDEFSGMISDQVKLRRFKNQIKILEKASEYLKGKGIEPKKLNLKVLAPMVELSSLEEDETLQNKWSKLISNVLTDDSSIRLEQSAISILNKISSKEALLHDLIYKTFTTKRTEKFQKLNGRSKFVKQFTDVKINWISISLKELKDKSKYTEEDIDSYISNLVSLGIIKWDAPDVDVTAEKNSDDPTDLDIDVNVDVIEPDSIQITTLGIKFYQLCNE